MVFEILEYNRFQLAVFIMKRYLLWLLSVACIPIASTFSGPSYSDKIPTLTPDSISNDLNYKPPYFPLLGFQKYRGNPILKPNRLHAWEAWTAFNPSAIVVDDKVWLLYRAQDWLGTSSIGLAWSDDGIHFTRYRKPVLEPTEPYELPTGCEDPRVVRVNGTFYLTYTGKDKDVARLCLATSTDLIHWTKHGPILPNVSDVVYDFLHPLNSYITRHGWSKSGAIIDERQPDGRYYMHFGESYLYTAYSADLLHWNVSTSPDRLASFLNIGDQALPYAPKLHVWEQALMEPGPPPIKTRDGMWLKLYNGVAVGTGGFETLQYTTGQMLLDPAHRPAGPPVARLEAPMLKPDKGRILFTEGIVQFHGKWYIYYGMEDESVGVAIADLQP